MYETTLNNVSPVWSRYTDLILDHGSGSNVYDIQGRRFLDFTTGIGVTSTGHCHPKVVAAIQDQAAKLIHGQINIYYHKPLLELIEALKPIMLPGLDSYYFTNSGAESIEAAVKLSKQATGRSNVIVFTGGFHGRTHLTMAMTSSKVGLRQNYQPLVSGVFFAPYPYPYYYGLDEELTTDLCMRDLKKIFKGQCAPEETACIVIEPVLGEGGYVVPPKRFMKELRDLCTGYGILLVADEVQSGFGRTGKYFAIEHFDIVPDVITVAKGIASGMPVSGVITRSELAAKWTPGSHGGTYGGNAVACASAVATLDVLRDEHLLENAEKRGEQLRSRLRDLQKQYPVLGDVRGLGLMNAVEFTRDGEPDASTRKAVMAAALENGLILLPCGTFDNIIRWIPPLVVTAEEIDEAIEIFTKALAMVVK